jgi:pimeloyl-ACP methyl ester carboxylesterase
MLGAGFPPLTDDDVRRIRTPTLLLTGEHSPTFLLRLTDVLERLLPLARQVEIPAASHVMHEENPAAVNRAILDFLDWQRRDASGVSRPIAIASTASGLTAGRPTDES